MITTKPLRVVMTCPGKCWEALLVGGNLSDVVVRLGDVVSPGDGVLRAVAEKIKTSLPHGSVIVGGDVFAFQVMPD